MSELARVLDNIVIAIKRFCVLPSLAAETVALWVAFTWAHDAAQASPILLIKSPIKRCGKTTLLRVVHLFVRQPLTASSLSPAVAFRMIAQESPTLLMDEADTYIRRSEDWRSILNGGHTRDTAQVLRCEGKDFKPKAFSTWAPKVIAMIGKPPETILDRSIVIEMQRKIPGQTVSKLRRRDRDGLAPLRVSLAKEMEPHIDTLRDAVPILPPSLNDRAGDCWEPLLAIADLSGDHWPQTARRAARAVSGDDGRDPDEDIELLANIREALNGHADDRIFSADLVALLNGRPDWRWTADEIAGPLTEKLLASHLEPFGIGPKTVRNGEEVKRGYRLSAFEDVFRRYLPPLPSGTATPQQARSLNFRPDRTGVTHRARLYEDVHSDIPNFLDLKVQ